MTRALRGYQKLNMRLDRVILSCPSRAFHYSGGGGVNKPKTVPGEALRGAGEARLVVEGGQAVEERGEGRIVRLCK